MTTLHDKLGIALQQESEKFQESYRWLEESMPSIFFKEMSPENLMLITHNLMSFPHQDYFSTLHLKDGAIVLCKDVPDADLKILEHYSTYGIKNYQAYISRTKLPFPGVNEKLRVVNLIFLESKEDLKSTLNSTYKEDTWKHLQSSHLNISREEFEALLSELGDRFIQALSPETLAATLEMYYRAKTRDSCQYILKTNMDWEKDQKPSLQIILAWKNIPKYRFLYRLARTIYRHHVVIKKVDATYLNPFGTESVLLMILDLHGANGQAVEDVADMTEFLQELVTVKYFSSFDLYDEKLVSKGIISGNMANVLRAMTNFVHQNLLVIDPNLYSIENIEEGFCRHPELTAKLLEAFVAKFHPEKRDYKRYEQLRSEFLKLVNHLDTGQEEYDQRRKNILLQAMNMVHHTYKTNAFRYNFTALSFRLNPAYLDEIPFDRSKKFPELPYAIFYIKGMHYFGFHIRFKDLARGGLRTVFPEQAERMALERNTVFSECYHLALTQHLKNKDIPEGGAKGIIFLKPYDPLGNEVEIYKRTLEASNMEPNLVEEKIALYHKEQVTEYLYQAQRSFVETLTTLVNCKPDGSLKAGRIVDYWKRPEYLYLGPDENMHDAMIQWIADFSKAHDYRPGTAFISSKPKVGINHKEYGVTSLGINVYMREFLKFIGIDPITDPFTIKIAGGPDGDVAGNQIHNLYRFYPRTAKLLSVLDISGTAYDPLGLDLGELNELFRQGKPIRHYSPEKLHEDGFILDKRTRKETSALTQQTLCWRKINGQLVQDWLSGSDMNHLLKQNIHQTKTDVFIPAGGRPRTLNESNFKEFLDESGKPTSKIIIEGANLYLTPQARREYEKLGTLIVKDSSANKTGVISSSFEVLCGLTLGDDLFYQEKEILVKEILSRLELVAYNEASLLLKEHQATGAYLTDISAKISERINHFTYQLLDHIEPIVLSNNLKDPFTQCFLNYCLPTLRTKYKDLLIKEIPDQHKKAIISCYIGSELVYKNGLRWFPSIVDVLPVILETLPVN